MKVRPGQTIPSKPLTSVVLQPFLQFTLKIKHELNNLLRIGSYQNIRICHSGQIGQQLLLVRSARVFKLEMNEIFGQILRKRKTYSRVNSILDGVNDLIDPGGLGVVVAGDAELPGQEPADGHGLEVALALVLQARHLAPGVGGLQGSPGLGINPWLGQPVVCPAGK